MKGLFLPPPPPPKVNVAALASLGTVSVRVINLVYAYIGRESFIGIYA